MPIEELDIKPEPIKPKTKEVKIQDLKSIFERIQGLPDAIGRAIGTGNSTGVTNGINDILKEYKRKLL